MNVLSLFDGMGCGRIALELEGIKVDNYFASEIKPHGIALSKRNFPDIIHLGDVTKLDTDKLPKIDLLIGGSPCQDLSGANKHQTGLEGLKSKLFYRYVEIFKAVKPTYFLLENVASMKDSDRDIITGIMGVEPIEVNSSLMSAQLRKRYYWTNLEYDQYAEDTNELLQNVLTEGYTNRTKSRCLLESDSRPPLDKRRLFHRYHAKGFSNIVFKDEQHYNDCVEFYDSTFKGLSASECDRKIEEENVDLSVFNDIRVLNQTELERLQKVPEGYTASLSRNEAACLLGDGWTVSVIQHFFRGLK